MTAAEVEQLLEHATAVVEAVDGELRAS